MALTATQNYKNPEGKYWRYGYTVTWDSSYPTDGEELTATILAIRKIKNVIPGPAIASDGSTAVVVAWDKTNGKLIAFESAATGLVMLEKGSAESLAGYTCEIEVVGY